MPIVEQLNTLQYLFTTQYLPVNSLLQLAALRFAAGATVPQLWADLKTAAAYQSQHEKQLHQSYYLQGLKPSKKITTWEA